MPIGLDAIEQTDWSKLHHAYGRATDTPGHLRALLAEDAAGRKAAMEHLWSAIIHQGTPWTATGRVAQIVAGLLSDERIDQGAMPLRAALLSFLVEVAAAVENAGMSVEELQAMAAGADLSVLERGDDGAYDEVFEDEAASNAYFARSVLDCAHASRAIMDAMLADLHHADPAVRVRAARGAAELAKRALPDRKADVAAQLLEMARGEKDADHQASLVMSLGELGEPVVEFLRDAPAKVRVCAALAQGMQTNLDATAVLLDAFNQHVTEIDGWFRNRPPQFEAHPRFYIIARLVEVVTDFERLLPGAIAVTTIAHHNTVDRDWGPLLASAFPDGSGEVRTDTQRQFLQALVDRRELWDPVYANPLKWFRKAGLQYNRKACGEKLR